MFCLPECWPMPMNCRTIFPKDTAQLPDGLNRSVFGWRGSILNPENSRGRPITGLSGLMTIGPGFPNRFGFSAIFPKKEPGSVELCGKLKVSKNQAFDSLSDIISDTSFNAILQSDRCSL